jgi:hypothetical protein
MGPPWKEHDGHGEVSEWTTRDKRPGERVLASDRSSHRYYDYAGAIKIAKRDGWGLSEDAIAALGKKLGRAPTKGDIAAASVESDFNHLRGWANDEWHWEGYVCEIDGEHHDSCWGYDDDDDYKAETTREAFESAIESIDKEEAESFDAACRDIATVG